MRIKPHPEITDNFIVDGHTVALAPGTYTPLPDPEDPGYQDIRDALEAQLLSVIDAAANPPPAPLPELKRARIEQAQAEQERRLGFGFRVSVGQNAFILSSDPGQRELMNIYATSIAGGLTFPPSGIRLITRTGDELTANLVQFQMAFAAWRNRVKALRDHYADIVAAIRAADDSQALAAVDVTAGWPAV